MVITVIGELCRDVFKYGNVTRLCPEAPVPILTDIYKELNWGMAGNVKENLLAHNPELNINLIHQKNLIKKTRYIDDKTNHMFLRVDEGENEVDKLILTPEKVEDITKSDLVIVSDYNKGSVSESLLRYLDTLSVPVFVDTKKTNLNIFKNLIFKINQKELAQELGIDEPKISKILHHRIDEFSTDRLIELYSRLDPDLKLKVG
jgi:bifunctional ADP-heptose synthase (sugar kinase/adenylyltransferase)